MESRGTYCLPLSLVTSVFRGLSVHIAQYTKPLLFSFCIPLRQLFFFYKHCLIYLIRKVDFFKKFIYFQLFRVFVSVRGLSLVVASGGHFSSWCAGLSLSRPLLLRSTGSRRAGSVVVAHRPSCSAACGIFPDQGSNPCPLHWQADSQPLRHHGSPRQLFFKPLVASLSGSWN